MCSGEEQVRVDELHLTVQLLHVKRTSGPWERAARLGSPRAEVCVRPETTLFLTYYVKALPVLRNGTLHKVPLPVSQYDCLYTVSTAVYTVPQSWYCTVQYM